MMFADPREKNTAGDLWDVEWSAFLPVWGKSSVPHYKWDSTAAAAWGHNVDRQVWSQDSASKWNKGSEWNGSKVAVRQSANWDQRQVDTVQSKQVRRHTNADPVSVPTVQKHVADIGTSDSMPSVGSAGHDQGLCKRCAFFPKGRCKNGAECTHCHMDHPKQVRHRRRPQHRPGRRADDVELVHPQKLEISMYVARAQQDAVATLREMRDADDEDDDIDDSSEDECPVPTKSYFAAHIMPRCADTFWERLYQSFILQPVRSNNEAPNKTKKKSIDFEVMLDAETTCGSGASDTDTQSYLLSTDSEMKVHCLTSCDEGSDVDFSGRKERLQLKGGKTPAPWKPQGRNLVQVEVRSITGTNLTQTRGAMSDFDSAKLCIEEVPVTPGSWVAQQRLRRSLEQETELVSAEELGRKALGLLNKLTQERFDSICEQIIALPSSTVDHLGAIVAAIFEKATTEKGFLNLHTELCARLDTHFATNACQIGGKMFRKALVAECQACFERNLRAPFDPQSVTDMSYEGRYEMEVKHKTRTLGNMRFIGQLLVRKLLAAKVFFFIVNEMLDIGDDTALESLAELLLVVAPVFEQKQTIYSAPLREVFAALKKKSKDSKVSTCIRCKLCDLLDARSRSWTPRESPQL